MVQVQPEQKVHETPSQPVTWYGWPGQKARPCLKNNQSKKG
jgi:hypothetical protein